MDEKLAAVLAHWCEEQGLPCLDAEELALQPNLTPEQKHFVNSFCVVWDGAVLGLSYAG
jgi:hypothetical protein